MAFEVAPVKLLHRVCNVFALAAFAGAVLLAGPSNAQKPAARVSPAPTPPPVMYPALPSEMPATFVPTNDGFDYVRREAMIPMRDGVKLHTVILVPKSPGAKTAPMLLTRTPYDADKLTTINDSAHLGPALDGYDNAVETIVEGGYIRVVQDVRGKHGSEGDYVMNRPVHGPQNPTPVDHATDTYDTIDWLVKNVPESNGKVGILGISYDGFLPLMALVNPHPALKVSVPMNPMVDGWMGDDWFHNGAFRQLGMSYIYDQEATRKSEKKWWTSHFDDYDTFMEAGSAGELGRRRGLEQVGFWNKLLAASELRRLLARPGGRQDARGAAAQGARDAGPQPVGPGRHLRRARRLQGDQAEGHGQRQGLPRDGSLASRPGDPGRQRARRDQVRQRHRALLPPGDPAPVPRPVPEGRRSEGRRRARHGVRDRDERVAAAARVAGRLRERLHGEGDAALSRLRIEAELRGAEARRPEQAFDEYVSDPAKPVPFHARPIVPGSFDKGQSWREWLVTDQREASGTPGRRCRSCRTS